ncbi:MAG: HdeD family acid-resistance protein [Campylobacteraceae bacterium]|nr:HdeD family acid-resistance protein [Campylobacteraceae bacterium]
MKVFEGRFLDIVAKDWWVILLRGIVAVLFGIALFFVPEAGVLTFVFLFAFMALFDGALGIYIGIDSRKEVKKWWVILLGGIAGVIAGILSLIFPINAALVLFLFISAWIIAVGISQIVAAIELRKEIENEWLIIISGALSIIAGIILIANPLSGTLALVWLSAGFAVAYGIMLIIASFKFRKIKKELDKERDNGPVEVNIHKQD